jgi:hypothetical protein
VCQDALRRVFNLTNRVWSEEIWLHTFQTWVRALREIVGVQCAGVAVTDLRFLIEMRGIKAMGGKILHLQAPD